MWVNANEIRSLDDGGWREMIRCNATQRPYTDAFSVGTVGKPEPITVAE